MQRVGLLNVHISGNEVFQFSVIILSFNFSYTGLLFIRVPILDFSRKFPLMLACFLLVFLDFLVFQLLIKHFINQDVLDFVSLLVYSLIYEC